MTGTETVQLRHEEPDGGWHIDWMLSRDESSLLVTIKLEDRLEVLEAGSQVGGVFLGNHRRRYLAYEGQLSDDRGVVSRIASGHVLEWVCNGDNWWITVQWDEGPRQQFQITLESKATPGTNCVISTHHPGSGV